MPKGVRFCRLCGARGADTKRYFAWYHSYCDPEKPVTAQPSTYSRVTGEFAARTPKREGRK